MEQQKQQNNELSKQVETLRIIATSYNLINKGLYPAGHDMLVDASLKFLSALHTKGLEDCLAHPDADLFPELKNVKGGSNE